MRAPERSAPSSLRAHELGGEQARSAKACAAEVGVKRPGLVERRPVEIGAGKVRSVEARRLQLASPQIEPRQV